MAAIGSDGTEGATNTCGLRNQGGYVVMATFQITYNSQVENLLLMRDVKGQSAYNGDWSASDTARWTNANKLLVPFLLDVTLQSVYSKGIFVAPIGVFATATCMKWAVIGYQRQGYVRGRYDAEWVNATSGTAAGAFSPNIGRWFSNTENAQDLTGTTRFTAQFTMYLS